MPASPTEGQPPLFPPLQGRHLIRTLSIAFLVSALAGLIMFYITRAYVIFQAERNVENLLLSHRAIHLYVQRDMHPALYRYQAKGELSKDFYAPELFSSSYIVRVQHVFYNQARLKAGLPEVYYKLAADNPRNPVNRADPQEEELNRRFNQDRSLTHYSRVVEENGKRYLFYTVPFLANEKRCLKCHGRREDAPRQLQERYPGQGGFNETVGRIRAIESIKAPLAEEYRVVTVVTGALLAGVLTIVGLFIFSHSLHRTVGERTEELVIENQGRLRVEEELRQLNQELEKRVAGRTAQLEAANQELDSFAYSVSHDLRAPLRGINGFGAALLEDYGPSLDEQARMYVERIQAGCVRMGELIDDLLKMSRLSRGELNRQPVELSRLAAEIMAELQNATPERRAKVHIEEGLRANADPVLIRAVLENLLGNAWKFTAQVEEAAISLGKTEENGVATYHLRDNGAGFDMRHADKLFAVFQRLHSPGEFEGTGIGLATVQRIIHRHGGRIWAQAAPGQGASFFFTLG